MFIKQLSVFIENTPGRLADFTQLLGENQIDLVALSIADTSQYGILRGIVADYEKALKLICEAGYTARLTNVLAVSVSDEPGGLARVLKILNENEIGIEYLYSFVRHTDQNALVIMRVEDLEKAAKLLEQSGVVMLAQEEVKNL